MNKLLLPIALVFSTALTAQITITSADMPNAGDSVLISVANSIDTNDINLTGANYTWDYSTLIPTLASPLFAVIIPGLMFCQLPPGNPLGGGPWGPGTGFIPTVELLKMYKASCPGSSEKALKATWIRCVLALEGIKLMLAFALLL